MPVSTVLHGHESCTHHFDRRQWLAAVLQRGCGASIDEPHARAGMELDRLRRRDAGAL